MPTTRWAEGQGQDRIVGSRQGCVYAVFNLELLASLTGLDLKDFSKRDYTISEKKLQMPCAAQAVYAILPVGTLRGRKKLCWNWLNKSSRNTCAKILLNWNQVIPFACISRWLRAHASVCRCLRVLLFACMGPASTAASPCGA